MRNAISIVRSVAPSELAPMGWLIPGAPLRSTLSLELRGWERFQNRRQIGSYTGLCPGIHNSNGRVEKAASIGAVTGWCATSSLKWLGAFCVGTRLPAAQKTAHCSAQQASQCRPSSTSQARCLDGLCLERGTVRTSTARVLARACSRRTNSSIVRVECPIVSATKGSASDFISPL